MHKAFLTLNFITLQAFANSQANDGNLAAALNQNAYEPNYFSMILGLFLVIGLIYLTGYLYQKMTGINLKNGAKEKNNINIISTTSIGQNKNLHIVEINEKYCLIGATQYNIALIKELDKSDIYKPEAENEQNSKNCK